MTICQKHRFDNPEKFQREREREIGQSPGNFRGSSGKFWQVEGLSGSPGG